MSKIQFQDGTTVEVDGEPTHDQVVAIWNDLQSKQAPDIAPTAPASSPQEGTPNKFMDILGSSAQQAVTALPPVANMVNPQGYNDAFMNGMNPQVHQAMDVPEVPGNLISQALSLKFPEDYTRPLTDPNARNAFARGVTADIAGSMTAPISYAIPAAIEAAGLIPFGKSTIGKLIQLPINRIKDAITGEVAPEVVDRFLSKIATLKKLNKHLPEKFKSQAVPTSAENVPNIDKWKPQSIDPYDEVTSPKPSVEIPGQQAQAPTPSKKLPAMNSIFKDNSLVKDETFDVIMGKNDKATAENLRYEHSGKTNEQVVIGNQFGDEIQKIVPEKVKREGMFWYKEAKGNMDVLKGALEDPSFKDVKDQIQAAMNLSEKEKMMIQASEKFFNQIGEQAHRLGTVKNLLENYQNRLYVPEKETDFVSGMSKGLRKTTIHGKERYFQTAFDAVRAGKKFLTTDISENLPIYNEEMARLSNSVKMGNAMVEHGIGKIIKEGDAVPKGWSRVGNSSLHAPSNIAENIKALHEPNFLKTQDWFNALEKYQGTLKTSKLALSVYHHLTFLSQQLNDVGILGTLENISKHSLDSPDFLAGERDLARYGGMTTKVGENADVIRRLMIEDKSISNIPVIKQYLELNDASSKILFDKMQRFIKVTGYMKHIGNWLESHPNATASEVRAAKIGYAKYANASFGGQNWEALGITKTQLAIFRSIALAPDWLVSNAQLPFYALGGGTSSTASGAARINIVRGIIYGTIFGEGLNKAITGHYTDKNEVGHKFDIEIAPHVYVPMYRGSLGEMTKIGTQIAKEGPIKGSINYTRNKLNIIPSETVGLMSGTQYGQVPISSKNTNPKARDFIKKHVSKKAFDQVKKTYDYAKYISGQNAPIPFGPSSISDYMKEPKKNSVGFGAISIGAGRYSPPQGGKRKKGGFK